MGTHFIEHQNRRFLQERTSQRNALTLTAGKTAAPFGNFRMPTIGKLTDEFIRFRRRNRFRYSLIGNRAT